MTVRGDYYNERAVPLNPSRINPSSRGILRKNIYEITKGQIKAAKIGQDSFKYKELTNGVDISLSKYKASIQKYTKLTEKITEIEKQIERLSKSGSIDETKLLEDKKILLEKDKEAQHKSSDEALKEYYSLKNQMETLKKPKVRFCEEVKARIEGIDSIRKLSDEPKPLTEKKEPTKLGS